MVTASVFVLLRVDVPVSSETHLVQAALGPAGVRRLVEPSLFQSHTPRIIDQFLLLLRCQEPLKNYQTRQQSASVGTATSSCSSAACCSRLASIRSALEFFMATGNNQHNICGQHNVGVAFVCDRVECGKMSRASEAVLHVRAYGRQGVEFALSGPKSYEKRGPLPGG
ncbi:hypothetical protein GQ600_7552 [Phytophthora cactorum]|nr:hypothetical protein GQ600_7552 [Phytophthora cactorum]